MMIWSRCWRAGRREKGKNWINGVLGRQDGVDDVCDVWTRGDLEGDGKEESDDEGGDGAEDGVARSVGLRLQCQPVILKSSMHCNVGNMLDSHSHSDDGLPLVLKSRSTIYVGFSSLSSTPS